MWLIISTSTLLGELCLCDLLHVTKRNHIVWYTVHCIRELKPSRIMVKFRTQCNFHQCNFHIVCVWVSLFSKQWCKLEQWGIQDYLLEWVPTEILMETCCTFGFLNQWYNRQFTLCLSGLLPVTWGYNRAVDCFHKKLTVCRKYLCYTSIMISVAQCSSSQFFVCICCILESVVVNTLEQ